MNAAQRAGLSDAALALTEPIIEDLIKSICRRIREAGAITDTAEYEIYRAQALGASKKEIAQAVAKQLEIQQPLIDALFDYILDKSLAFEDNGSLRQIADAYAKMTKDKTADQLQNLWAQTPDGEVVPIQDAYYRSMDYAFRQIATGAVDHETAIRKACAGLAKRGLRTIEQKSGRSIGIEYAIRRYLMDQFGRLDDEVTKANHDYLGCDGWEISAHAACAPDHEDIQGRQFSDAEFNALNARLQRPIGHLNCGHVASPIILGVNSPQYSEAELRQMKRENERGVTYRGRRYTLYEAGQEQAAIENAIRNQRRSILVAEETGDPKLEQMQIRLKVTENEYRRFCDATNQPTRTERLQVAGFGRSQANRAVWTYQKSQGMLQETAGKMYAITDESIRAVPNPGFSGLTPKMNAQAQEYGRQVLKKVKDLPLGTEATVSFTLDSKVVKWAVGADAADSVRAQHIAVPFYALHNHASNGILSSNDIQALIRDKNMRGIAAVGHKGALYTCEKSFTYNQETVDRFWKQLSAKYPNYKKDASQQIAFIEELMKEAVKYGLIFKG